jgi:hypothetical protein
MGVIYTDSILTYKRLIIFAWKCKLNSHEKGEKEIKGRAKCVFSGTVVARNRQSKACISSHLLSLHANHHVLKSQYYQLLPHSRGALHLGTLPPTEASSDAELNVCFVLKLALFLPQPSFVSKVFISVVWISRWSERSAWSTRAL